MSKWIIKTIRFDSNKINEEPFESYTDACAAYERIEKNTDLTPETAGGRIKLQSSNGTTLKMSFVV